MLPPLDALGLRPFEPPSTRKSGARELPAAHEVSARLQFCLPPGRGESKMTTQEGFAFANARQDFSAGGVGGLQFGRPPPTVQPLAYDGQGRPAGAKRTRTKRGKKIGRSNVADPIGPTSSSSEVLEN